MILARNHRSPLLPPNFKIGFPSAQLSSWEDSLDCLNRASLCYRHSRLWCHTADLNCTRLAGLKPCVYLRNLVVKVRFELTLGTVWRCCTTIMLLYHMLTHSAPLTTLFLSIQDETGMNPVAPLGCLYLSIQIESVFAYGRSTGNRTLINRLKAYYFSR